MSTMILQKPDASGGIFSRLLEPLLSMSTASSTYAAVEQTVVEEPTFPTEEVMRIVETSIANMDAGRLSEPINAQVDHYLELLADELDEDW